MEVTAVEFERIGRFTIAKAKSSEGKLIGVGISRCSELDAFKEDLGKQIAEGRARKSVANKLGHNRQQCPLMG